MVVELRGVEFVNKGGELMLHAILEKLRNEYPQVTLVMEHSRRAPRSKHLENRMFTKTNVQWKGISLNSIFRFVPKPIRRKMRFVAENEIDVVLDGSGFAFGDFWGAQKAGTRMADHIMKWKRDGKKVILLPQALGPFTDTSLIEKMKVIVTHADLIFARDEYSLRYIKGVDPQAHNIHLRPDFTNLIEGRVPSYFDTERKQIAIIPNYKLLESQVFNRDEYVKVIKDIVEYIVKRGATPFFLIHEGAKDQELADLLNRKYSKTIRVIVEEDPLLVKGIIGASDGVVTSRFHGLVSALAQAIPCLCIGWSHKYRALMEDYKYQDGLIEKHIIEQNGLNSKLELILDNSHRNNIIERLKTSSQEQKKRSEDMWQAVFETID